MELEDAIAWESEVTDGLDALFHQLWNRLGAESIPKRFCKCGRRLNSKNPRRCSVCQEKKRAKAIERIVNPSKRVNKPVTLLSGRKRLAPRRIL